MLFHIYFFAVIGLFCSAYADDDTRRAFDVDESSVLQVKSPQVMTGNGRVGMENASWPAKFHWSEAEGEAASPQGCGWKIAAHLDQQLQCKNWMGNVEWSPKTFHMPESQEELIDIVTKAHRLGISIKIVGSGHSWSNISVPGPDGITISLRRLNNVLSVTPTGQNGNAHIKVEAGINVDKLNQELEKRNYSFPTIISAIAYQAVAGAIATDSHGSGSNGWGKSMSGSIVSLDILRTDGTRVTVAKGDPLYNAAITGIGFCGIIANATFEVAPRFFLRRITTLVHNFSARILDRLDEVKENLPSEAMMFHWYWVPAIDQGVIIYGMPATLSEVDDEKCPCMGMHEYYRQLLTHMLNDTWFSTFGQHCSPGTMTPDYTWATQFLVRWDSCVDTAYKAMGHAETQPVRFWDIEYAFEEEKGHKVLRNMVQFLKDMNETSRRHSEYMSLDLHGRFGEVGEGLMSLCSDSAECMYLEMSLQANIPYEMIGYIPAYHYPVPSIETFNVWAKHFVHIAHNFSGRPHWGKMHNQYELPGYIRSVYPQVDRFLTDCSSLDPQHLLQNEFFQTHLADTL